MVAASTVSRRAGSAEGSVAPRGLRPPSSQRTGSERSDKSDRTLRLPSPLDFNLGMRTSLLFWRQVQMVTSRDVGRTPTSDAHRYSAVPSDRMMEAEQQVDEDAWSQHTSSVSTPTDRLRFLESFALLIESRHLNAQLAVDGSEV